MPPVALDVHLAVALADGLARAGVDVVHIARWQEYEVRTASDDLILAATTATGRVLITRDANTLPALANRWVREGRHHAGLILLSKRINQDDIGGMLDAILQTIRDTDSETFANAVVHAQRRR